MMNPTDTTWFLFEALRLCDIRTQKARSGVHVQYSCLTAAARTVSTRAVDAHTVLARKQGVYMSVIDRSKLRQGVVALAIMLASVLLVAPAAQARVGIGLNLGFPPIVAPPPVVVAPPVMAAPPVVVGPPAYYAPPPAYYYAPAPSYGFFWYDRFGHRHWHR
jgi:hypothetical protein